MSSCSKQPWACGAGLTPVDVAINNKQVAIVRRLEHGAAFAGWLSQKVSKYVSYPTKCQLKLAAAHVGTCSWHSPAIQVTQTGCSWEA